ncbi:MAG TPA: trigger factor [Actinomycetes bacterium]|nr:trigger factor [Actinomycetes bacterium]
MKTDVETLSPTRVRLSIEIPFDELQPNVDAAYKKIASQITIPGFRKGKVPAQIIDQRVGRGAVLDEAVNEALPKAYGDAVSENDIKVLGQPDVEVGEFADGQPLTFTAEVDVRPEIELPDIASLEVTVDTAEVSDDDIDTELEQLRQRFATLKAVDRGAQKGDLLSISMASTKDGEPVEALSATGLTYEVGSESLLPGLDDAVTGLREGEEAQFSVTPESGDLQGQSVDVSVTVSSVRERELPDLDDAFAELVSEHDTLEELRNTIRNELEPRSKVQQLMAARDAVLNALVEQVDVPLPEGVVANAVADHFQDGHGDADHKDEFENQVRESLTRDLVLDTLADRDDVQVTQAELTEYLIRQAPQYGMSPDQFAQAIAQAGQVSAIVGDVRRSKALSLVLEQATVLDRDGNVVEMSASGGSESETSEDADEATDQGTGEGAGEDVRDDTA